MQTIKEFPETQISVEEGVITIRQTNRSYSTNRIEIPILLWDTVCDIIATEFENQERKSDEPISDEG